MTMAFSSLFRKKSTIDNKHLIKQLNIITIYHPFSSYISTYMKHALQYTYDMVFFCNSTKCLKILHISHTWIYLNKCQRKPKGQSRMDSSEKLATSGSQDTKRRQKKGKQKQHKQLKL